MKKILAWILVFCMSLSMMPMTAFAVSDVEGDITNTEDSTTMEETPDVGASDGNDVTMLSNTLIFGEKAEFSGDYVEFLFTPETDGYYGVYIDASEDIYLEINSPDYDVYKYGTVFANNLKCLTAMLTAGITYTVSIYSNGVAGSVWIGEGVYVTSLEIIQLPDRLTYVQGFISDGLDLTGLHLTVTWSDGTTYEHVQSDDNLPIYLDDGTVINAEADEENGTVTMLCEEAAAGYEVNVTENPVAGLELINADELPGLLENAYYVDYNGYQPHVIYRKALFQVTFTDGTTAIAGMGEYVADYDISAQREMNGPGGTNTITFSLLGHTVTYDAHFVENPVAGIELISEPDPFVFGQNSQVFKSDDGSIRFTADWGCRYDGLVFRINYVDGTSEEVSFADLVWPASGVDFYKLPDYKNYPVEVMFYMPEYGSEFAYWTGSKEADENGRVPMIMHYMGSYLFFDVTVQKCTGHSYEDGTCIWCGEQEGLATGACGEDLYWSFDANTGVMTITGTGSMYSFDDVQPCPWDGIKNLILELDIQEGVTSVGDWAFIGCSNLTELKLPGTMKSLGDYAFYDCSGLKQLILPDGLVSIGDSSFDFCMGLESVVIPDSVETIGFNAFTFCSNLESVVIGNGVTVIGGSAFAYDYNLSELVMGSSVEVISQEVFCGCDSLTELTIPASIQEIQTYSMPTELKKITFMGDAPEFPESVNEETGESYPNEAFYGITATAYYPAGNDTWTEEVMQDYGGTITWVAYEPEGTDPSEPSEPSEPEVEPIQITQQPADFVGVVGETATFSVAAEGENLQYQWYYYDTAASEWKKASNGTAATLNVEFKAHRYNQQYRCEITDAEGNTVVSDAAKITAQYMDLEIITQPVSFTGAVNDDLTFAVEATGNGLTYQWYYSSDDGGYWSKSGTPGFNEASVHPILRAYRDGNQYKCVITDIFGNSVTTDVVTMTIKASEITITQQPASVEYAVYNQLYKFTVEAEGENLTYLWEVSTDGGETWVQSWSQGYESATLSVRMYDYRNGYQYRCVVTSGLKTVVITEPASLVMQDASVQIVGQPENVYALSGATATFTVEATGTDLTYVWYRSNDKGLTWIQTYLSGYNTDTLSFAANASRAAMFKCKVTDGSGKFEWTDPVKLQILSAELQILSQPESIDCAGGETAVFAVEAQGDSLKYQWYSSADGGATWTKSYLTGYNTAEFSFVVNAGRAAKVYKCVITDVAGNVVETNVVSVTME